MAADDATEKDSPSATDETEDNDDVEGHAPRQRKRLTPDPEVLSPRASDDDRSEPAESHHAV